MPAILTAIRCCFAPGRFFTRRALLFLSFFGWPLLTQSAIIGTNPPALPLTAQRISLLPRGERSTWQKYLDRSHRQMKADKKFFSDELKKHAIKQSTFPPRGHSAKSIPMNQTDDWYGQPEARRIADIIVSFQTPAGGWSKNLDMTQHRRAPGEHFADSNVFLLSGDANYDSPADLQWNYVGTFDNDATITQLRFLARVISAAGKKTARPLIAAFRRGMDYIMNAQYPNGGWPQVWPLQGGYHDAVTYNDGAMCNVMELLDDVAAPAKDFHFVDKSTRARAGKSLQHAIDCVLACQIKTGDRLTVWAQQHDVLTLAPCSARNYEMPAQCGSESAGILTFLMRQPNPSPALQTAVHSAVAWFEKTQLRDVEFKPVGNEGRQLVASPGNGPIWSRYYEIGSDRPIFGDRDKTIHDNVNEISRERRTGYSWFGGSPARALEEYARWTHSHPSQTTRR